MPSVRYGVEDSIAWITLDRPETLNASNLEMKRELHKALDRSASDTAVRTIVLTGSGRSFCVGGDMKESKGYDAAKYRNSLSLHNAACLVIRDTDKPVIAAINGYALAGGLEIAMMCDVRIAGRSARFGIPVVAAGSASTAGLYHQLIRCIGLTRTVELVLLGEQIPARRAARLGIVTAVVPDDALRSVVTALAARLAALPAEGLALAKRALRRAADIDFVTSVDFDTALAMDARFGGRAMR